MSTCTVLNRSDRHRKEILGCYIMFHATPQTPEPLRTRDPEGNEAREAARRDTVRMPDSGGTATAGRL